MVRTRNFMLFLAAVGFLIVAIVFTMLLGSRGMVGNALAPSVDFDMTTATYTAQVVIAPDTREDNLESMRRKLRDIKTEISAPPETTINAPEATSTDEALVVEKDEVRPVKICTPTRKQKMVWAVTPQQYAVRGAERVFYTEMVIPAIDASSTPVVTETISLKLPLRTETLSFTTCIPSEVVAVTTTGLPIRNSDYSRYEGVGAATLIGYSIDGFEIYGEAGTDITADECGGAVVGGVYRYYLDKNRPGVLGCFAGIPVVL